MEEGGQQEGDWYFQKGGGGIYDAVMYPYILYSLYIPNKQHILYINIDTTIFLTVTNFFYNFQYDINKLIPLALPSYFNNPFTMSEG